MRKYACYTLIVGSVAALSLAGFYAVGFDIRLIVVVVALAAVAIAVLIDLLSTWEIWK